MQNPVGLLPMGAPSPPHGDLTSSKKAQHSLQSEKKMCHLAFYAQSAFVQELLPLSLDSPGDPEPLEFVTHQQDSPGSLEQ